MSAQAMGWALDQDLPARPKLVLVAVANHADHTDGYCWLKADTIAAESSHSVRSVYRTLAALERNGFLRRKKRKGADGKQRANDYWILFNRIEAKFEWRKGVPDDEMEDEHDAEAHGSDDAAPQDVEGEISTPEQATSPGPSDVAGHRNAASEQAASCGPTAMGVSPKDSEEPSKTNPENPGLRKSAPRRYRPPPPDPPQPMGSTTLNGSGELIFVYENSRAYKAWAIRKANENRVHRWHLTTNKVVDGHLRTGWYFPTLFPPGEQDTEEIEPIDPPFRHAKTG